MIPDGTEVFPNIGSFILVRDKCPFCQERLRIRLTSFTKAIPELNSPLIGSEFSFKLSRVTQEYTLEAKGLIDIRSNALVFVTPDGSDTPSVDQRLAWQVFEDLSPVIELSCSNKKCKLQYHLRSCALKCNYLGKKSDAWMIRPLQLWYEGVVEKKYVAHNYFKDNSTAIFSRTHSSEPITTDMMDWEEMGSDKVLTRIRTLVTFS